MTLPPRPRIEVDDTPGGESAPDAVPVGPGPVQQAVQQAVRLPDAAGSASGPARDAPLPRIMLEESPAPRLSPAASPEVMDLPLPRRLPLVLAGVATLAAGVGTLSLGGFVADQFARAAWLGWVTAGVAALGFGLLGAGVWRELAALRALERVDRLRASLASGEAGRIMAAAREWGGRVPGGADLAPALAVVNDPDAALALLRAGPGRTLREGADGLGRVAAVQVVAGIAAMPAPALDVLLVGWRGVRLVRQVAALYGVRPGLLGTLSLLRRTAMAATLVGAAEIAGNTLAHGLLSSPLLAKAIGEAAGAGVAARRMVVLGRAAAAACDPVPP